MSKHFLCCIPVRFGVFIISLTTMLGWGALAGGVFYLLARFEQNKATIEYNLETKFNTHVNTGEEVGWGITGGIYAIFALVSLFGLIGAIQRNRKFVRLYSRLMWFLWVVNLLLSIAIIVGLVIARSKGKLRDAADRCSTLDTEDADLQQTCRDFIDNLDKTSTVVGWSVAFVIQLLWQLYGCIIIARYVTQLSEEQAYLASYSNTASAFSTDGRQKSYYPHEAVGGETEMLTQGGHYQGGQYPYSDPHHAFGAQKA